MSVLKKISDGIDRVCGVLIVLMIGAMVIITTAQIIFRTWFTALSWSDEVTRYLLIWSTFLGATCVYRRSGNISITFVRELFPPKASKWLRILGQVLCLILVVILAWYGFKYAANLKKTATSLPIKMSYVFLVVPVSMVISVLHSVVMIAEELTGKTGEVKD